MWSFAVSGHGFIYSVRAQSHELAAQSALLLAEQDGVRKLPHTLWCVKEGQGMSECWEMLVAPLAADANVDLPIARRARR